MKPLSEAQFQRQVIQLAALLGYRVYHTHDSRRSAAGFPDLVLVHPKRGTVFAELKTDTGKVKPEQAEWLADLQAAGQRAYLWRPADFDQITTILRGE
jgi:hypothetical protein